MAIIALSSYGIQAIIFGPGWKWHDMIYKVVISNKRPTFSHKKSLADQMLKASFLLKNYQLNRDMDLKVAIFVICCLASANSQQCHVQGEVNGIVKVAQDVTSYNECLNYCKADPDCTCFTYYKDTQECREFSEYTSLDISCTTCISGEPACPEYYNCNIDGFCRGTPDWLTDYFQSCSSWSHLI